ncbi:threonine synthase [Blattabacterium cuenoti]|uniref:Threonine synthase n=1 Tax=Blattabacterium cuenoti STAT TaxID=1457030 RepID=A0A224AKC4_9FLAO|nr:threonine synthase [Blattabacterium cuenoti]BBA17080.1 threonine synthase [Blattabacterium cuenoti STAT]
MLYYSLKNYKKLVSFEDAVLTGLSPDGGLYMPQYIPKLGSKFFQEFLIYDNYTISMFIIKPYIGKYIPKKILDEIIHDTLSFSFPLKNIHDNIHVLELFHGPTLAFKDVGAKFMAGCLSFFSEKIGKNVTVLVATSGDTGGAVANGFYKKPGIEVIILYPHNGISSIQQKQIASLGDNIYALEIYGNFDDCQNMVKKAFLDQEIKKKYMLTSANSINIGRWLPQMFYYFLAYKKIIVNKNPIELIFSVPSGNFGNICAGMIAEKMGLPIKFFIASTNINDTIPRFLKSEEYNPIPVKKTISNAMDISNPSNFSRIWHLYKKNIFQLRKKLFSYKFTDKETLDIIKKTWKKYNYMLDPHGAIGYLGIIKYLKKQNKINNISEPFIFLETAHPIKFLDHMPLCLKQKIVPDQELDFFLRKKNKIKKISLSNNFSVFKNWLLERK